MKKFLDQISTMLKEKVILQAEIQVIFQPVRKSYIKLVLKNLGDWYFTGNYPTPGGNKVVNQAFINYLRRIRKKGVLGFIFTKQF